MIVIDITRHDVSSIQWMAYDAWGLRQRDTGRVDPFLNPAHGDRGYTGHKHLDELGLIHMNGRVFDPVLARFLSPDPMLQSPNDLQNYNRYSYVLNNPLKYTDPSGQFCVPCVAFIVGLALTTMGNEQWSMVGKFVLMFALSGPGGLVESGLGNAISVANNASGFVASNAFNAGMFGNSFVAAASTSLISSGGDLGEAIKSGIFAGAFTVVGGSTTGATRVAAHALLGCVQGAASGGKCGPSALAAATGKLTTEQFNGPPSPQQFFATVVAGGTVSVIGGGKFGNGAYQAGFGYLFNHCARDPRCLLREAGEQIVVGIQSVAQGVKELAWSLMPGSGAIDCLQHGCTALGSAMAAADFIPGGKVVALGEKGLAHVMVRHIAGGAESAGKSLFNNEATCQPWQQTHQRSYLFHPGKTSCV